MFIVCVGLLALSSVLLVVALGAESRTTANLARTAARQTPFALGQDINTGSATIKLSNPSYSDGAGPFAAPAGKHYLILDFSVKNYSATTINVLPGADTYVKGADNHPLYLAPFTLTEPFRPGGLAPGETMVGQLSYLVPISGNVTFYLDSIWSGRVIPVATH